MIISDDPPLKGDEADIPIKDPYVENTWSQIEIPDPKNVKIYNELYVSENDFLPKEIIQAPGRLGNKKANDYLKQALQFEDENHKLSTGRDKIIKALNDYRTDLSDANSLRVQTALLDLFGGRSDFPKVTLVGDQTVGKSTLAMLFALINFSYTAGEFATRCPVWVRVRKSHTLQLRFNEEKVESINELTGYMKEHMISLPEVVDTPLRIDIASPDVTNELDWFDLPGVPNNGIETRYQRTHELITKYSQEENNLIVYVFDVRADPDTVDTKLRQRMINFAREGKHVVGFGNYANLLPAQAEPTVSVALEKWKEKLPGIPIWFGGVDLTIKMKNDPDFANTAKKEITKADTSIMDWIERIGYNGVPRETIGFKRFHDKITNLLKHMRTKYLNEYKVSLRSDIEKAKDTVKSMVHKTEETINVEQLRAVLTLFCEYIGAAKNVRSTIEVKYCHSNDIFKLQWSDAFESYNPRIVASIGTTAEAIVRRQRYFAANNITDYEVPETDIPDDYMPMRVHPKYSSAQAGFGRDMEKLEEFFNEQAPENPFNTNWISYMSKASSKAYAVSAPKISLGYFVDDLFFRMHGQWPGPSTKNVNQFANMGYGNAVVYAMHILYPEALKSMSKHIHLEDHALLVASWDLAFVLRETIRAAFNVFFDTVPCKADTFLASSEFANEWNRVVRDAVEHTRKKFYDGLVKRWKALVAEANLVVVDDDSYSANLMKLLNLWRDVHEAPEAGLEMCVTKLPFILMETFARGDEDVPGGVIASKLEARSIRTFQMCARYYFHRQIRRLYTEVLKDAALEFSEFLSQMKYLLSQKLTPNKDPTTSEQLRNEDILERYNLHHLPVSLERLRKATEENLRIKHDLLDTLSTIPSPLLV